MERQEAIGKLNSLVGEDLHKLAHKYGVTVCKNGKINKGWAGHVFERHLQLPINSAQAPNFGSWELKSIPLKKLKNGELTVKETMAITMIDPVDVRQKKFKDSHLLSKLRKALIVTRIVGKNALEPSYLHSVVEFNLDNNINFYNQVDQDYNLVRDMIIQNDFHSLHSKIGTYVQPRTKGSGHGSQSRAFYARTSFLKKVVFG